MNGLFRNQKGDTLVEVMLAAAVLSLVLAGAFSISNKATRINQNANERTQVSNLIQRQAELIRASFKNDSSAFWADISGYYTSENTGFCDLSTGKNIPEDKAFYFDDSLSTNTIPNAPSLADDGSDDHFYVWVEAVDDGASPTRYADFYIYACWDGVGGEGIQRTGLVTRLAK